jgi:dGTPase
MEFVLRDKDYYLKLEENLSPFAQRNTGLAIKRINPDDPECKPILEGERTPFQLDRDKILHSRAFRRLMHKTQVVTITKGYHFRTRLTHVLEVSQIARSIAKLLGVNEELTEAIALGHDLGHTPFGHIGERTLNFIISGKELIGEHSINFGGFKHNFQSVHIADNLEQWSMDDTGFNLTLAVRDGMLKHTGLTYDDKIVKYPELKLLTFDSDIPFTIEGQIVKISDDIAQTTHDLEDGYRLGIIKAEDFAPYPLIEEVCSKLDITATKLKSFDTRQLRCCIIGPMVGHLIHDCVSATVKNIEECYPDNKYPEKHVNKLVTFSNKVTNDRKQLAKLVTELFITSMEVSTMDGRAEHIIKNLFRAYWEKPAQLPDLILRKYFLKKGIKNFSRMDIPDKLSEMHQDQCFARTICDHIAGMTDNYAFSEYKKLYMPE